MSYALNYNGYTLQNDANTNITSLEGIGLPPIRTSEANRTGADGGNVWASKYAMRTISIEAQVYADDLTDYYDVRRDIAKAFAITDTTPLLLTRSDGIQRALNAFVVYGPDFTEEPGERGDAKFRIELRCDDPLFRDVVSVDYTTTLAQGGGTPIPSPIASPLASRSSGVLNIINSGDVEAYATFVITGPCTNPTVTNLTTSEFFQLAMTLGSGETVTVSKTNQGEFVLKGTTNVRQYFVGDIFPIILGSNAIKYTSSSFNTTTTLTATFFNRYLSI